MDAAFEGRCRHNLYPPASPGFPTERPGSSFLETRPAPGYANGVPGRLRVRAPRKINPSNLENMAQNIIETVRLDRLDQEIVSQIELRPVAGLVRVQAS